MDNTTAFSMTSVLLILLFGAISSTDAVWIPPCHKVVKRSARTQKHTISEIQEINGELEMNAEDTKHNLNENSRKSRETRVNDLLENLEKLEKLEQESLVSGGFLVLPSKNCDNPWTTLYIPQLNSLLPNDVVDLLISHRDIVSPIPKSGNLRDTPQKFYNNEANIPRTFKVYFQNEPQPIIYQQSHPIPRPDVNQISSPGAQINIPFTPQSRVADPVISQPSFNTHSPVSSPFYSHSNQIYQDTNIQAIPIPVQEQNISNSPITSRPEQPQTSPETFIHTNPNCPHYTGFDQSTYPLRQQPTYQYVQSYQ